MFNWKTAGAGLAALGLLAAGQHALAQDDPHAVPAAHAEEHAEMMRQVTALTALLIQHADADAIEAHLTALISENAAVIGGDTDALAAHVSEVLRLMAERAQAEPDAAAEHIVHMIAEAHTAMQD